MKRMLSLIMTVICLCVTFNAIADEPYDSIDAMGLDELLDVQAYVNSRTLELRSSTNSESAEIRTSADRSSPALVGEPIECDDNHVIVTVMYSLQGESANTIAKSFNKYNVKWRLDKGEEWALVYIKIEAIGSSSEKVSIDSYDFRIVDDKGIECEYTSLSDNPKEISDMFGDSVQYAWFGAPVKKNAKVCLTYEPSYDSDLVWFDLSMRALVDTSKETYTTPQKKDTGDLVDAIQLALSEYDCMKKAPSGVFDSDTIAAIKKFQKLIGMKASGTADDETLRRLFSGAPITD